MHSSVLYSALANDLYIDEFYKPLLLQDFICFNSSNRLIDWSTVYYSEEPTFGKLDDYLGSVLKSVRFVRQRECLNLFYFDVSSFFHWN